MFISDIFIYQQLCILWLVRWRRSPDRMVDGFITTYTMSIYHYSVVSSNPAQARCTRYNIVWSSLSATWGQVGSFPRILRLPPPIKLTATIFLKVLKVALNAIAITLWPVGTSLHWFARSDTSPGADPGGGAPGAPPLKLEKIWFFLRKIVIFHTKYPNNFRASLRSAHFF